MPKKSAADKTVRKTAKEIVCPSEADLSRLRAAMRVSVDTAEIPARRSNQRVTRDANGQIIPRTKARRNGSAKKKVPA